MAKTIILIIGSILFLSSTYALPQDRDEIFYLSSDEADISQSKNKGLFKGHVKIDQGSSHLRSAEAETHGDENNKLVKAIAKGNQQKKAHFWTILTQNQPELHAWADIIYYFPKQNRIELVGNAEVSQGDNTFKAPKIIYDTEKQHILTERQENKRTTITFHPEKKS